MGINSSVKTISLLMAEHSDGGVDVIFDSVQTSDSLPDQTNATASWARRSKNESGKPVTCV